MVSNSITFQEAANWDRFMPWRTIDGKEVAPRGSVELEVLLKGVFEKRRFLDLVLNFVVFDDDGAAIVKKAADGAGWFVPMIDH